MTLKIETIPQMLQKRVSETPSALAFMEKNIAGAWTGIKWHCFYKTVVRLATGFVLSGLKPGDGLAILMQNRIAWEIVQHAGFMAGCRVIGLDLNDPLERFDQILRMSRIRALAVYNPKLLERFPAALLDSLILILAVEDDLPEKKYRHMKGLSKLITRSCPDILPKIETKNCATLLFTSGTTGNPKAIAYEHGQLVKAVEGITAQFSTLPDQAHSACWLPLASPFQRMINLCGVAVNLKTYMVADPSCILNAAREISPHFLAGVPRFYEKIYDNIQDKVRQLPWLMRAGVKAAEKAGNRYYKAQQENRPVSWRLSMAYFMADFFFLKQFKTIFGKNIRFFISGSASISKSLLENFRAWGWLILESYGVSENIVPMTMNTVNHCCLGTVGRPLPQNSLKIAPDGEILVKGEGVAKKGGAVTCDGFLRTGDTGFVDDQGYLHLTGRKSDEFKLSTGRKISPLMIESALQQICGVLYAVVFGEGQKYVAALLNISSDTWQEWVKQLGSKQATHEFIKTEITRVAKGLPSYCRPVVFDIIHSPFTVETGELTGNFKIRRGHVLKKYRHRLESLYLSGIQAGFVTVSSPDINAGGNI